MSKDDFSQAIDIAPSIKPNRYTTIHIGANRERAKALLVEDKILAKILK
jgi:glycerol-1-phosphate dehydrogenase [NAD(P)+]